MSSPSALIKVNYLVMRYLHFGSVRGDLQEGHGCSSRCQSLYFRAHKRHFCALLPFGTLVFGHFEHKIEVFVLFWPSGPPFSGVSSTKSGFLCSFTKLDVGVGALSSRQRHRRTCAAYTTADATAASLAEPLHLRSRRTCAAVVSAQPLCHLPSPVAAYRRSCRCYRRFTCVAVVPAQPLCRLPSPVAAYRRCRRCCCCSPLHLLSRCTCGAAAPAQPSHLRSRYYRSLPPSHLPARAG